MYFYFTNTKLAIKQYNNLFLIYKKMLNKKIIKNIKK